MVSLSEKEVQLMASVISNIQGGEDVLVRLINFKAVQAETEYKNVAVTKVMLNRLFAKLNGAADSPERSKTSTTSKPQGVTKETPSKRGRKSKLVTDYFASNDAGGPKVVDKAEEKEEVMATGFNLLNEGYDGDGGLEMEYDPEGDLVFKYDGDTEANVQHETSGADKVEGQDEQKE